MLFATFTLFKIWCDTQQTNEKKLANTLVSTLVACYLNHQLVFIGLFYHINLQLKNASWQFESSDIQKP